MNRRNWLVLCVSAATLLAAAAPRPKIAVKKRPTVSFELLFHDLKVQGQWLRLGDGKWAWQPRGVDHDWRPYSQGTWVITEVGWYWLSEHAWGYATSHYGFWQRDDKEGWVWQPTGEWSPANVIWAQGDEGLAWSPQSVPGPGGVQDTGARQVGVTMVRWKDLSSELLPRPDRAAKRAIANALEAVDLTKTPPNTTDNDVRKALGGVVRMIVAKPTTVGGKKHWAGPDASLVETKTQRQLTPVAMIDTSHRREVLVVAKDRTLLVAYHPDIRENANAIQAFISKKAEQYREIRGPSPRPTPRTLPGRKPGRVIIRD